MRQAINDRELHSLFWPLKLAGVEQRCPVQVGEVFELRSCTIEITRIERTNRQGHRIWRASFHRFDKAPDRPLLLSRSGDYTHDVKQATRLGEDVFREIPATIDAVDQEARSIEHKNVGEPLHPPSPDCENCDGRGCMACVLRKAHCRCKDDCPICCADNFESTSIEVVALEDNQRLLRVAEEEADRKFTAMVAELEETIRHHHGNYKAEVEKRGEVERQRENAICERDGYVQGKLRERDRAEAAESRLSSVEAEVADALKGEEELYAAAKRNDDRDGMLAHGAACVTLKPILQLLRGAGTEQGESNG